MRIPLHLAALHKHAHRYGSQTEPTEIPDPEPDDWEADARAADEAWRNTDV